MATLKPTQLITVALAVASVVLVSILLISLTASISGQLGQLHHIAGAGSTV